MITKEEIIKKAIPIMEFKTSAIYFLINCNNEIVYVGKSKRGKIRISEHFNDKTFSSYTIIPVSEKKLDILENKYIMEFKPIYNKKINSNILYFTLKQLNKYLYKLGYKYKIKQLQKILEGTKIYIEPSGEKVYLIDEVLKAIKTKSEEQENGKYINY